jgi:hypothetical protein
MEAHTEINTNTNTHSALLNFTSFFLLTLQRNCRFIFKNEISNRYETKRNLDDKVSEHILE